MAEQLDLPPYQAVKGVQEQEPLSSWAFEDVSAWTDDEISWIESVGGYVYENTQEAVDEQITSQADDFYTISEDVTYEIDQVFSIVEEDNASLWDTTRDWIVDGYEWVEDKVSNVYETTKDWVTGQTANQADDFYTTSGDVAASLDRATAEERQAGGSIEWGITASLAEDIANAVDRSWWENLSFDFPEFSLDPLGGILGNLVNTIAARIEAFIATALDLKLGGK